jgi:hypothetical protein
LPCELPRYRFRVGTQAHSDGGWALFLGRCTPAVVVRRAPPPDRLAESQSRNSPMCETLRQAVLDLSELGEVDGSLQFGWGLPPDHTSSIGLPASDREIRSVLWFHYEW